jgi:hypothetical protein
MCSTTGRVLFQEFSELHSSAASAHAHGGPFSPGLAVTPQKPPRPANHVSRAVEKRGAEGLRQFVFARDGARA